MAELTLKVDASALRDTLSDAAVDVLSERWRQISGEGWTPEHDDEHDQGEMALAAASYIQSAFYLPPDYTAQPSPDNWPWSRSWWKPKSRRRDLVRAAALIIAEIERLDRAAERGMQELADESQKMGMY